MKRAKLTAVVLPLLALLFVSCDDKEEQPSYFVVKVDSISAPDTIMAGEDLAVGLWGTIGHDGRYGFSHFEARATDSSLDITAWGKFTPADYAAQPIVDIDGRQYHTVAGSPGTFAIRTHQPDGTILRDSATVVASDSSALPPPQVARIEAVTAPDTVRVGETFTVEFRAVLGVHSGYALDHIDTLRTRSFLAVRIWSRDFSAGRYVTWGIVKRDYSFTAVASTPGEFSIIACQSGDSTTEKSVVVLP